MSTLTTYLTEIADALREKKETEGVIPAQNFADEIRSISEIGTMEFEDNEGNLHKVLSITDTGKPVLISDVDLGSSYYHFLPCKASDGNIIAGCITGSSDLELRKYSSDLSQNLDNLTLSESFSSLYGQVIILNNNDIVISDGMNYTKYIDYNSFEVVWSIEEGGAIQEYGDEFLLNSGENGIKIINSSGTESGKWISSDIDSRAFFVYNDEYCIASGTYPFDDMLYKYTKSGATVWEVEIKANDSTYSNVSSINRIEVMENENIVILTPDDSDQNGTIQVLTTTGTLKQRIKTVGSYFNFHIDGTLLFVTDNTGYSSEGVTKYETAGGAVNEVWFYPIEFTGSIDQYPFSVDSVVNVFDGREVHRLSKENGYEVGTII